MADSIFFLSYAALSPFLYLFAKSSDAAIQTVLHALFLPSSIKVAPTSNSPGPVASNTKTKAEYVRGGAFYTECEPFNFPVRSEEQFGGEEGGQLIWEHLERELAKWRKSEDASSTREKDGPKI